MTELDSTLKVGRRNAINNSSQGARKAPKSKTGRGEEPSDRVSLSQTSKVKASVSSKAGSASDIRRDLVDKFRNVLNQGSYVVKADEIADKIVQKIRENKNRVIL